MTDSSNTKKYKKDYSFTSFLLWKVFEFETSPSTDKNSLDYEEKLLKFRAQTCLEMYKKDGNNYLRYKEYINSITIEELLLRIKNHSWDANELPEVQILEIIDDIIDDNRNKHLPTFLPGSNIKRILEIEEYLKSNYSRYSSILMSDIYFHLETSNEMVDKILKEFPNLERQYVVDCMMDHNLDNYEALKCIREKERN